MALALMSSDSVCRISLQKIKNQVLHASMSMLSHSSVDLSHGHSLSSSSFEWLACYQVKEHDSKEPHITGDGVLLLLFQLRRLLFIDQALDDLQLKVSELNGAIPSIDVNALWG